MWASREWNCHNSIEYLYLCCHLVLFLFILKCEFMFIYSFIFHSFPYTVPQGQMAQWCMITPSRRFGGTRHRCNICGKSYGHQTSLVHHQKVHSGETTCTICNKVLNRIFDLKMHLSFVHGINESNPEWGH